MPLTMVWRRIEVFGFHINKKQRFMRSERLILPESFQVLLNFVLCIDLLTFIQDSFNWFIIRFISFVHVGLTSKIARIESNVSRMKKSIDNNSKDITGIAMISWMKMDGWGVTPLMGYSARQIIMHLTFFCLIEIPKFHVY